MNKLLLDLIKTDLPVVLDYDGVLFEVRFYHRHVHMQDETEIKLNLEKTKGRHLYTAPIPYMHEFLSIAYGDVFVLSHIHNAIEYETKKKMLDRYFPEISSGRLIRAHCAEGKIAHLKNIYAIYGGFIYIDDNHTYCYQIEDYFGGEYGATEYPNAFIFHASSIYAAKSIEGRMSWEEIKKTYPDHFVYLADVERSADNSTSIQSAVVVYASPESSDEYVGRCIKGELVEEYTTPENLSASVGGLTTNIDNLLEALEEAKEVEAVRRREERSRL